MTKKEPAADKEERPPQAPTFMIVIGASAGGLTALSELVTHFTPGMDAAFCIVLHLSGTAISDFLAHRLQQFTSLPCRLATHGQSIQKDHIYIAPPDAHLLVKENSLVIGRGPRENRWRPSIDVLFRSAATAYDGHAIGMVLTGLLKDGTAGMWAIKRCGGTCIVQDPNEAQYPDMSLNILNTMEVDYCLPLAAMAGAIHEIIGQKASKEKITIPEEIKVESAIAERTVTGLEIVSELGNKSLYACPDCGGGLWHIRDAQIDRYRCHIGHSYTEKDLVLKQGEQVESSLWVALRMMEERRALLKRMELDRRQKGFVRTAAQQQQQATELQVHIDELKKLIFSIQQQNNNEIPGALA